MIRRSVLCLNNITNVKLDKVNDLVFEYKRYMQKIINIMWNHKFKGSYVDFIKLKVDVVTTLTERYKQCAIKQALGLVKSSRSLDGSKPIIHNISLELDERFVEIQPGENSFDVWIKLSVLKGRPILIPAKKHFHFNKFSGWKQLKSTRLRVNKRGLFLDVFFEQETPDIKTGSVEGVDLGYNKLAVLSNGQILGPELKQMIQKYYHRKNSHQIIGDYINHELKKIDLTNISILIMEDLKNVKYKSKLSRHTNRLLSHWAYRQALDKLGMIVEENRVRPCKYNPKYTSQVCNACFRKLIKAGNTYEEALKGARKKSNRKNERYECRCGWKVDADYNASLNIRDFGLLNGVYGPVVETFNSRNDILFER